MNDSLVLKALAREEVPRRPLWIMRQAGRCLPEYRAMRKDHSFKALSGRPDLAAEVSLLPLKRFPFDAAIVFADIMSPLPALDVQFEFAPGPVIADPIRDLAGVDALQPADPDLLAPEVIETIARVREAAPHDVAVLGFCGAPWTLAAYLVEGRGVKDFPTLRAFAAKEPEVLSALLGKLSAAMADYLIAQAKAGADAVQVFDSWAGLLSLADWRRLIRPHLEGLLNAVGTVGVPRILFVQNAPHLIDAYAELPAEAISVDWRTDIAEAQQRWPDRAVQGNIDPAVLLGGEAATRRAAKDLLGRVDRRGHVVNLGHGLLPETPLASIDALVEAVHDETSHE